MTFMRTSEVCHYTASFTVSVSFTDVYVCTWTCGDYSAYFMDVSVLGGGSMSGSIHYSLSIRLFLLSATADQLNVNNGSNETVLI